MKGFFKEGKLFFGTQDGIGSGFFSGATFWGAQLNGFGKNSKNQFSDTFKNNSLPTTHFGDKMFGTKAALVEVIRDNLDNDLETVFKKAEAATNKAQAEADQKAQNEADKKAKIKKETLQLADQTAQTASQNEYNTIIRQPVLKEDHYVYECMIDSYIYTGGVNKDGKPHGVGKQVSKTQTYEGAFINGKSHGLGKQVSNESIYFGQFENDKRKGLGLEINNGKETVYMDKNIDNHLSIIVKQNLKTDIETFVKENITDKEENIKSNAIADAKIKYTEKLTNAKRDFNLLENAFITTGTQLIGGTDYYLGQKNDKGMHGYGIYKYKKEIKRGIFLDNKFVFGELVELNSENIEVPNFLGFSTDYYKKGCGLFGEIFTDGLSKDNKLDKDATEFSKTMKGFDRGFIEVLEENIKKNVDEVVVEAKKAATAAIDKNIDKVNKDPKLQTEFSFMLGDGKHKTYENTDKTNTGSYDWKKIGLASAAVGLGAAGIYYLHKKHKEYKQSKKSKPRGKQTRSKRSKPSNRRTRSKRSDREQRRSGSGSTRSSSRSNAEHRRTRSKRSDNQRQSKRSSRKTRRSSQRSSE
jgi:hypothetical protein